MAKKKQDSPQTQDSSEAMIQTAGMPFPEPAFIPVGDMLAPHPAFFQNEKLRDEMIDMMVRVATGGGLDSPEASEPNPSAMTPEEQHDWAYDRLAEAIQVGKKDYSRVRELLLPIIEYPTEDNQLMSGVYATLGRVELHDVGGFGESIDEIRAGMERSGTRANRWS